MNVKRLLICFLLAFHCSPVGLCVLAMFIVSSVATFVDFLSDKGVIFGAPITEEGIAQIYQLIEYLSKSKYDTLFPLSPPPSF